MAVTHVNTQTGTEAANTSVTANKPTGSSSGDLMVAVFVSNSQNCTPPSGWTELFDQTIEVFRTQVFYKVHAASEPSNYTFSVGSDAPLVLSISAFRGPETSGPIDITPATETATTHSEPYTTPSVTGGTGGRLLYLRTCRRSGTSPATFTAAVGATEVSDVGVFSGGSVSYSLGLYLADADYSGSGSKSGLAITASQTESHNVVATWGLKFSEIPGTMGFTMPSIPSVSMSGSVATPAEVDITMPLPEMDFTIFNGEFTGELDVAVPIAFAFTGHSDLAGDMALTILPVFDVMGETRRFAENVVAVDREERWIVVTQDGWYEGSRAAVREFKILVTMPLPEVSIEMNARGAFETPPIPVTVGDAHITSTSPVEVTDAVTVAASDATVLIGESSFAGAVSASAVANNVSAIIKTNVDSVTGAVLAHEAGLARTFADAELVTVTCAANDADNANLTLAQAGHASVACHN